MADETEIKEPAENSLAVRESYEIRKMAREMTKDAAGLFFNVIKFEHAQRVASMLAKSTMVPEQFRQNIGNCMIALNYADRLNMDPFMLMQTMYVVHGRPGIEGKALIALINRSGLFDGPLEWEFTGKKGAEDWTCIAYATHSKTSRKLEMPIDWKTVKAEGWLGKQGSKWLSMPEQMFRYRTASWFANAYCPEVKLGLQTVEELQDMAAVEMTRQDNGAFVRLAPPVENVKAATESKLAEMKQRLAADSAKQQEEELQKAEDEYPENHRIIHKAEVAPGKPPVDDSGPLTRDKWIRLKGPGFRAYIEDNEDCIGDLSLNLFSEMSRKWAALYDEVFPYNPDGGKREFEPMDPPQAKEESPTNGVSSKEIEARLVKTDILNGYAREWKLALERLGMGPDLPDELDALIAVQEACVEILKEKNNDQL
jgi:hypothetical protein